MGWYLRKSVRFGPVKFNLSKSGVGASVGVTGFRVGVRPNGRSYIHAGRYGLYFREELGGGKPRKAGAGPSPPRQQSAWQPANPAGVTAYESASSEQLAPQSKKEFLDRLNQSYQGIRYDYVCGAGFAVLSAAEFTNRPIAGIAVAFLGIILFALVARWETRRRTIAIHYDFEEDGGEHYKKIIAAFNTLAACSKIWSITKTEALYEGHQSKLNAGARWLATQAGAEVGEGKPPWVETNIDVPVLKARDRAMYWMPDGILVYDRSGVGFVGYDDLRYEIGLTRFITETPASDAIVVDHTWKYPNKSGGPDKRFKNNYQIPVCHYGELRVTSSQGLNFYFMTSRHDAVRQFGAAFDEVRQANARNAKIMELALRPRENIEEWVERVHKAGKESDIALLDKEKMLPIARQYPPKVGEWPDKWAQRVQQELADRIEAEKTYLNTTESAIQETETPQAWIERVGSRLISSLVGAPVVGSDTDTANLLSMMVKALPPKPGESAHDWGRRAMAHFNLSQ